MVRNLFQSCLFFFLPIIAFCQDAYFSQFYASPLTLNPALTGLAPGDIRAVINYREQSKSLIPYSTYAASADMKILRSVLQYDVLSCGAFFLNDDIANGTLKSLQAMASLAYHKSFGATRKHFLSLGLQPGIFQRQLNTGILQFPNQWDDVNKNYDASIQHGLSFSSNQSTVLDMNAGVFWYHFIEDNSSVFAGFSAYHLNEPIESFLGNNERISRKYMFHAGRRIPFNNKIGMVPNALYMVQNKIAQITGGTSLEVKISEVAFVKAGVWYRYLDNSFITSVAFGLSSLDIGISYDMYSSIQQLANTGGGLEFSLIYSPVMKNIISLKPNPGISF